MLFYIVLGAQQKSLLFDTGTAPEARICGDSNFFQRASHERVPHPPDGLRTQNLMVSKNKSRKNEERS